MSENSNILFEKFEIIETIKKDQSSAVYISNHIYLGKKIFLKLINTDLINEKEIIERFKREAKLLAKLDHPNIIKVFDFGTYENNFYISFEYFESDDLRKIILKNKLQNNEKLDITKQLLKALFYAHSMGIIHRDIKPENILYNKNKILKISDFGLAHSAGENFVTAQFGIVGTPAYMSPEQIMGKKCGIQSDLFSAGILIYEIYTGKNPFMGTDINSSLNNIINFKDDIFWNEKHNLPEEIFSILQLMLKKETADRAASINELLNLLGEPDQIELKPKFVMKSKIIFWSVAILFIAAMSFIFYQNLGKSNVSNIIPQNKKSEVKNPEDSIKIHPVEIEKKEQSKPPGNENKINEIPAVVDKPQDKKNHETKSANTPAAVSYGRLNIKCFPWASVFIDSEKIGETPLNNSINLKTGRHIVRLSNPEFPKYEKEVYINSNQLIHIEVNLDTLWSYFKCSVFPWGSVKIDNKLIGETPFTSPIKIKSGKHILVIENPVFERIETFFTAVPKDTINFSFNFIENGTKK